MSQLTPIRTPAKIHTRKPVTMKQLLLLLVLSFALLFPAQALFAASYKIVYVEPINDLGESWRAPREIDDGTAGAASDTTVFNSRGRSYTAKEQVLYDSSTEGLGDLPFEAESDTEKAIQRAYKHLKYDVVVLEDRLKHAEKDLTIYLVNDANTTYLDDMDDEERDRAFWPHSSNNKRIIMGAVPLTSYNDANIQRVVAHEVTHHIDNTTWRSYNLPPGTIHSGREIYDHESTAWTEGIAMYYGKLKNPDRTTEPTGYRRVSEMREVHAANEARGEDEPRKFEKWYTRDELEPEELWKNESINALILYDIAKRRPLGENQVDDMFIKTNDGGDRTLKTYLQAYVKENPVDAFLVGEAIEEYIHKDEIDQVLGEGAGDKYLALEFKKNNLDHVQRQIRKYRGILGWFNKNLFGKDKYRDLLEQEEALISEIASLELTFMNDAVAFVDSGGKLPGKATSDSGDKAASRTPQVPDVDSLIGSDTDEGQAIPDVGGIDVNSGSEVDSKTGRLLK